MLCQGKTLIYVPFLFPRSQTNQTQVAMSEKLKELVTKSGESKQASNHSGIGFNNKAEGTCSPSAFKPQAIKVKYKQHPERGVQLYNSKGEHIKTVSDAYAKLIKRKSNTFILYYPQTKRIVDKEFNQFILHNKLKLLCDQYNTRLFYLTAPDQIFKNIVKDRDNEGNIEVYFTATLIYAGNTFTVRITKPMFKNLKAQPRLNHRYMGDKYTEMAELEVTSYLYNLEFVKQES